MTTRSHWPQWLWLMDGVILVVVIVASLGGLFMPALLLDLASFWPLFALGVLAGVLLAIWGRARDWLRLIPPLFVAAGLVLAISLHFAAWPELPSAAGDVQGPQLSSIQEAGVAVAMSGVLNVFSGSSLLYEVEVQRSGGSTGVPESLESVTATEARVTMRDSRDSFWFESEGWELRLAVEPAWAVDLRSPQLEADLRGLRLRSARLEGSGTAHLPTTDGIVQVDVSGNYVLSVPAGQPVQVIGAATVPDGWVSTADGWRAPTEGEGLLIVVHAGSVEVQER